MWVNQSCMPVPTELDNTFRVASPADIKVWSFGVLTAPRHYSATFHDNVKGTLHDQRIFGPTRDLTCACGKYAGHRFKGMVCDMCGVKVTQRSSRSRRFGHIEFATNVPHPLDPDAMMSCFPVIPADFTQSNKGQPLLRLYDELIESNNDGKHEEVRSITTAIVDLLTPVVLLLHNWSLNDDRDLLAHGIALETRS